MSDRTDATRRQWLACCASATGALAGIAGCFGDGGDDSGGNETAPSEGKGQQPGTDDSPADGPDGWPQYAVDHRLSGYHPSATGPDGEVDVKWEIEPGEDGNYINMQPVLHDSTLYVGTSASELFAIDFESGEVEWDWVSSMNTGDIETCTVLDDSLYVTGVGSRAIDRSDGTERWRQDSAPEGWVTYDGEFYGIAGGRDLTEFGVLVTIDRETGEQTVLREFEDGLGASEIAIRDGIGYVTYEDGVIALDIEDGETVWEWERSADVEPDIYGSVAIDEDTVYATEGEYLGVRGDTPEDERERPGLYAIDADTGEARWTGRLPSYPLVEPPAVDDDTVYVGTSQSTFAVDADDGEILWEIDQECRIKPAIVDGTVYARDDDLVALNPESGDVEWRYPASLGSRGNYVQPQPVVHDDVVIVAEEERLFALEAA